MQRRTVIVNTALALGVAVAAVAALSLGTIPLHPVGVLKAFTTGEASPQMALILFELRLPRVMAGALTGAAFALAGCLMQTLARNRLATPGIIGIDNAATAFAVASITGVGIGLAPPAMALVGAATAAALAFALAGRTGTRGYPFIMAGVGIGAIAGAITQLMLTRVAIDAANAAYPWTVGSLNSREAMATHLLAGGLALGWLAALGIGRHLNVLRLSETVATGLGTHPGRLRLAGLGIAILLTGLAVAVAGPVGFVALLGPEMARSVSHPARVPLTASALAGAILMLLADLAGRMILAPLEVPAGIVTAIAGSPWLLWILLRQTPGRAL